MLVFVKPANESHFSNILFHRKFTSPKSARWLHSLRSPVARTTSSRQKLSAADDRVGPAEYHEKDFAGTAATDWGYHGGGYLWLPTLPLCLKSLRFLILDFFSNAL